MLVSVLATRAHALHTELMTQTEQVTTEPTTTTTSFEYVAQALTERFGVTDWYDASHEYDTAEQARDRIDGLYGDTPTRIVKRTTIVVIVEEIL